jgi:ABC-type transport system substrate-binding protein
MAVPASQGAWIFEGKIKGLSEWARRAGAKLSELYDDLNDHYPFEHPEMEALIAQDVPGLRALDDHTLRVELTEPYPQFLWTTAMPYAFPYPREAVFKYGIELLHHPVGCGPYRVEDYWIFDRRITFVRNPTWHGQTYPTEGEPGDREKGHLDDAGRPLPFLDRVEFVTITASQPRWIEFLERRLDRVETDREIWEKAMTATGELRPELREQGVRLEIAPRADIAYTVFNMEDPVIGAPAGERGKKLRQAMCLAYDQELWIRIMRNGFWAQRAYGPIPPTVAGYVEEPKSPYVERDLPRARRLLAEAGYPEGRGLPRLRYEMNASDALTRNGSEIFVNCMREIGIGVDLVANTWDQFIEKANKKNAQIYGVAWGADYPDAQNFLQLFYGPNESPGPNGANYKNPEYDALYDRMKVMQDSPERDAVIRQMLAIINEDCPWQYTDHRRTYSYAYRWLKNYKYSDIGSWQFKYYRVDREEKARILAGSKARAE